jgi:hypothetical protein
MCRGLHRVGAVARVAGARYGLIVERCAWAWLFHGVANWLVAV